MKSSQKKSLWWFCKHFLFPALIVFIGISINNYYYDKKQPNIAASATQHQTHKISNDRFKIDCPFIIRNSGGSSSPGKKVTLIIPGSDAISEINCPPKYKGFFSVLPGGGVGFNYVVLSLDLPAGKMIDGIVTFYSNIEIPEDSMCPLQIIY